MSQNSFSQLSPASGGTQRAYYLPKPTLELMSDTSNAYDCFVYQQFSNSLQAFMVNYVQSIAGLYSVYM